MVLYKVNVTCILFKAYSWSPQLNEYPGPTYKMFKLY